MQNKEREMPVKVGDIVWIKPYGNATKIMWGYIVSAEVYSKHSFSFNWDCQVLAFINPIKPITMYSTNFGRMWGLPDDK